MAYADHAVRSVRAITPATLQWEINQVFYEFNAVVVGGLHMGHRVVHHRDDRQDEQPELEKHKREVFPCVILET